jgi:23S rRNA (cytosine1962-C5)-methyltransferase
MAEPALKLKANVKARAVQGHPWVFVNEVEEVLPSTLDGEVVECRDRNGRLLGVGLYNSASQIIWRRLSRDRVVLDAAYIQTAVRAAVARRPAVPNRRLIWSESDGLPGVVADQFGDVVVLQIQTLGMEKRSPLIAAAIQQAVGAKEIIFRNDAPIRRLEGLPHETHTLSGQTWEPRWINIDGFDYWLDLERGQKTGFYLDQREQHAVVARHAGQLAAKLGRPLRVLDGFCNQGPFALHIGRAIAQAGQTAFILGLDSAPEAILAARRNAERNRIPAQFEAANVFDWLNAPERSGDQPWDLIVMDPPPFTKKKGSLDGALRGYKEINLRALQSLAPGGILATYTCSHHMQDLELRGVLATAAADARRRVHITEWCHQPLDHPVIATMPESEYLRGYILTAE